MVVSPGLSETDLMRIWDDEPYLTGYPRAVTPGEFGDKPLPWNDAALPQTTRRRRLAPADAKFEG